MVKGGEVSDCVAPLSRQRAAAASPLSYGAQKGAALSKVCGTNTCRWCAELTKAPNLGAANHTTLGTANRVCCYPTAKGSLRMLDGRDP